jgi:hypothetical protein
MMERLKARIEKQGSANSQNPSCASAPQKIPKLSQSEVRKLRLEIERRFVETGILELPAGS